MSEPESPEGSEANPPVSIPDWGAPYLDPQALKSEAQAMADAFVQAIMEAIPSSEIEGIYFKGSASKHWDSPLDYLPELSDVDIHLHLAPEALPHYLGTLEQTLQIQARAEALFLRRMPIHLHFPRPQVMLLNDLLALPTFVPSLPSTVTVVFGRPYPPIGANTEWVKRIDRDNLLSHEPFVERLPVHTMDNPERYLWNSLRELSWRVSPTASRVLHLLGVPFGEAWGSNRTTMVRRLLEVGEESLARDYAGYYLHGWDYFLSGRNDGDAGRRALLSAARALRRGIVMAKAWQPDAEA